MQAATVIATGPQSTVERLGGGQRMLVTKTATPEGAQELREQVAYLEALPPHLRRHHPEVRGTRLESEPYHYVMPYYPGRTVRQIILNSADTAPAVSRSVADVLTFVVRHLHRWRSRPCPPEYVQVAYLDRAVARLRRAAAAAQIGDALRCPEIRVNGARFRSPTRVLADLAAGGYGLASMRPRHVCSTHGQLEFAHILLPHAGDGFILLDPKGPEPLLDPTYDLGKLLQSSAGAWDWVETGAFTLSGVSVDRGVLDLDGLDLLAPDRIEVCRAVHEEILRTLRRLADDGVSPDELERRCFFAAAMHLCASVPFAHAGRHVDRALVCYARAAVVLDAFTARST